MTIIELLNLPQQEWFLPNQEGEDVVVKGMVPKEPTNLIVEGFQIKQLPEAVRKVIKTRLNSCSLSFLKFDLFQLPEEAIVDNFLIVPCSQRVEIVGYYGYELRHTIKMLEDKSLVFECLDVTHAYLFCLINITENCQRFIGLIKKN